ncbi:UNVERIFIED_CONTAM: uncharacterized membrane protein YraQ (UPF0718 family) [Brevibacillus sp. OAP136]
MERWLDVKTLFLSILLEAVPFVLLGVFFSALIQTFVTDEQIRRWTPKHPLVALPFASLLGFLFPVCECAIIPIVRRLIHKGMPPYVGVTFLLAGPIVNPVVMAATYTAFIKQPEMVVYRSVLALVTALLVGAFVLFFFRNRVLRYGAEETAAHSSRGSSGIFAVFSHAVDEFFDMGKYLIFGALVSSILQVFLSRDTLSALGQTPLASHLVMMGLGYIFSLCSEADAFIAASFGNTFSTSSLLAFLVFGPMIDLKNTLMLLGSFRFAFVAALIAVTTVIVLVLSLVCGIWLDPHTLYR